MINFDPYEGKGFPKGSARRRMWEDPGNFWNGMGSEKIIAAEADFKKCETAGETKKNEKFDSNLALRGLFVREGDSEELKQRKQRSYLNRLRYFWAEVAGLRSGDWMILKAMKVQAAVLCEVLDDPEDLAPSQPSTSNVAATLRSGEGVQADDLQYIQNNSLYWTAHVRRVRVLCQIPWHSFGYEITTGCVGSNMILEDCAQPIYLKATGFKNVLHAIETPTSKRSAVILWLKKCMTSRAGRLGLASLGLSLSKAPDSAPQAAKKNYAAGTVAQPAANVARSSKSTIWAGVSASPPSLEELNRIIMLNQKNVPINPRENTYVKGGYNSGSRWVGFGMTSYGSQAVGVYFGEHDWQQKLCEYAKNLARTHIPGWKFNGIGLGVDNRTCVHTDGANAGWSAQISGGTYIEETKKSKSAEPGHLWIHDETGTIPRKVEADVK